MYAHATQTRETERKTQSSNPGTANANAKTLAFPKLQQPATVQLATSGAPPQIAETPASPVKNTTGMPDNLKVGIENLSGFAMDDVKVHYNSPKPAQLKAHAFARGTEIHIGPGQTRHLPHEAWHVVQQKQGRVKPTRQTDGGWQINDDSGLEREADVMGARARARATRTKWATDKHLGRPGSQNEREEESHSGTVGDRGDTAHRLIKGATGKGTSQTMRTQKAGRSGMILVTQLTREGRKADYGVVADYFRGKEIGANERQFINALERYSDTRHALAREEKDRLLSAIQRGLMNRDLMERLRNAVDARENHERAARWGHMQKHLQSGTLDEKYGGRILNTLMYRFQKWGLVPTTLVAQAAITRGIAGKGTAAWAFGTRALFTLILKLVRHAIPLPWKMRNPLAWNRLDSGVGLLCETAKAFETMDDDRKEKLKGMMPVVDLKDFGMYSNLVKKGRAGLMAVRTASDLLRAREFLGGKAVVLLNGLVGTTEVALGILKGVDIYGWINLVAKFIRHVATILYKFIIYTLRGGEGQEEERERLPQPTDEGGGARQVRFNPPAGRV